jgi:2-isopropylmalate synthase
MSRDRVTLFDTTLRDGAQTTGVDFSLEDKKAIATLLDRLGIDYVEGGYPGANPLDTAFFAEKRTKNARFTAFGMTKRAGRSVSNDPGIAALLEAEADAICFVAKAWDYHVRVALETTPEENLTGIHESVEAARAKGREVLVDCEHFFDGYKANPDYALSCVKTAYEAGARWIVLCDTNGGTLPHEVTEIVSTVTKVVPGAHLGIHAHDDCGCAVANSLAAIEAGARHIQGTLNGLGERCGNANLITLIGALKLKDGYAARFDLGVSDESLSQLTHVSRQVDEILNRQPNRHAPFVGASAFATKAGIHASAVLKDPRTYEHVEPEIVGNARKVLVSDQGGQSNILAELKRCGFELEKGDPRIARVLGEVKRKESEGFAFEGADASFYVLVKRMLRGHREGARGRRGADLGSRRQRPGERARCRAAQGSRQVPAPDPGSGAGRLQGAHLSGRFGCGHPRADRVRRRNRRALDHHRRLAQHHRRLVPGADGFHDLQAPEGRGDALETVMDPA